MIICIEAKEDGSFSVYEKTPEAAPAAMPGMEAGAEMPMGEMGTEAAPEGQPAASIDEALELARQMLQSDGRSPEEQMMAGYNKAKPPGMAKPSPEQVFGG
ncbi:MAG: hypothetical protein V4730_11795 [Pseudomonadota bacterium]